jgi:hypothetical protein
MKHRYAALPPIVVDFEGDPARHLDQPAIPEWRHLPVARGRRSSAAFAELCSGEGIWRNDGLAITIEELAATADFPKANFSAANPCIRDRRGSNDGSDSEPSE